MGLKPSPTRVAHRHLQARGLRFRDLPEADALMAGFRKLTKQWTSEYEADAALISLLERHGLWNTGRRAGPRENWEQWSLETDDGERIQEHLNVFHRPGMRPGWTAFQVSL